jgi:hypothetical protein
MRQRLDRIGTSASFALSSVEKENAVAYSLQQLLRAKPTAVLIASAAALAGPGDVIGRAMVRAGCHIAVSGPRGAGTFHLARLQGPCPDRVRSRLFLVQPAKYFGIDAASNAGPLPDLRGGRLPRACGLLDKTRQIHDFRCASEGSSGPAPRSSDDWQT